MWQVLRLRGTSMFSLKYSRPTGGAPQPTVGAEACWNKNIMFWGKRFSIENASLSWELPNIVRFDNIFRSRPRRPRDCSSG